MWSTSEHLLAVLIDEVRISNWLFAVANTPKGKRRPARPEPLPRPGLTKPNKGKRYGGTKRTYSKAQMRQILDRWK